MSGTNPLASALAPQMTPHGHLFAVPDADAQPLPVGLQDRLAGAFARGAGHGLLQLGAGEVGSALPPAWGWWRNFSARYVTLLCATPEGGEIAAAPPADEALQTLIADAPPMAGVEYLSIEVLATLWAEIDSALRTELAAAKVSLQEFLKARHPAWNFVGRVHFNLAENRKDAEAPFAFLATYTSRLSAHGSAQHLPLSRALAEFSDGRSQARLLSLLLPTGEMPMPGRTRLAGILGHRAPCPGSHLVAFVAAQCTLSGRNKCLYPAPNRYGSSKFAGRSRVVASLGRGQVVHAPFVPVSSVSANARRQVVPPLLANSRELPHNSACHADAREAPYYFFAPRSRAGARER